MRELDLAAEVEPVGRLSGQVGKERPRVEVVALEPAVDVGDDLRDERVHVDEAGEDVPVGVLYLLVELAEPVARRIEQGVDGPVPGRLRDREERLDAGFYLLLAVTKTTGHGA